MSRPNAIVDNHSFGDIGLFSYVRLIRVNFALISILKNCLEKSISFVEVRKNLNFVPWFIYASARTSTEFCCEKHYFKQSAVSSRFLILKDCSDVILHKDFPVSFIIISK